jgi:peroxiredoxin
MRRVLLAAAILLIFLPALAPAMELKVGDKAPDFTLLDTNWKKVSLHDFLGKKNVVLAFYVLAFTGG